jgi:phage shock protein A
MFGWIKRLIGLEEPKKEEPPIDEAVAKAIQAKATKINSFEKKIADLVARQRELEENVAAANHETNKWTHICEVAVETGTESNVYEAASKKLEAQQKLDRLTEESRKIKKIIEGLKEQLRFANDKIDYATATHANLTARMESAKIREDLAGGDTGPITEMDKLEEETYAAEGRAEAVEEISEYQKKFNEKNIVDHMDIKEEVSRLMGVKKK